MSGTKGEPDPNDPVIAEIIRLRKEEVSRLCEESKQRLAELLGAGMEQGLAMKDDPVVTTTMFTLAEKAAWEVAVERGLKVTAVDVRAMLRAARESERADG